jgi:hypothetical protein
MLDLITQMLFADKYYHDAHHYALFFSLLLLPPSEAQISSTAPCSKCPQSVAFPHCEWPKYKHTRLLPCRILVSLESRYGICGALPDEITKADITFPRADKERLIFEASLSLSPCNKLTHVLLSIATY